MTRHRFVNDGVSPIPMGATAKYACICGKRGTRAAIERHIAESSAPEETSDETARSSASASYASIVVKSDDDFGGDTKAHYLPIEPREPAPPMFTDDEMSDPELPPPTPLPPIPNEFACPLCQTGAIVADLPEIIAWSCDHWLRKKPQPIAESFQDMLRAAYQAGVLSATRGETFESWYHREVLQ